LAGKTESIGSPTTTRASPRLSTFKRTLTLEGHTACSWASALRRGSGRANLDASSRRSSEPPSASARPREAPGVFGSAHTSTVTMLDRKASGLPSCLLRFRGMILLLALKSDELSISPETTGEPS
jgi:hypothetical protein